jgi:hypothetical protein
MPNDYSDLLAPTLQQLKSMPNQSSAYSPALMLWKDRHGSQRNRRDQRPARAPNPHPAEQYVANHSSIKLGHQGNKGVPLGAQLVHQIGFV